MSPPTMVMPSGWRSSEPSPVPNASGSAPNSAAKVVIMIGRKRRRQASSIASRVSRPARSASSAKSTIMMAFFLTMPISNKTPIAAITVNWVSNTHSANAGGEQRGEDGERMDQALVENAQHEIDRNQRGDEQKRHARLRLLKGRG